MRILITGGAGFIGCNFVRYMLDRRPDDELVVLDALTYAGRLENLEDVRERIAFVRGDIRNAGDVASVGRCDAIVNFAAETHVDRSIGDPLSFVSTDVIGTATLLETARRWDVERFLQVSTDEVYGSTASGSFAENDPFNPSSPYSASKAGADLLSLAYHRTYGLPVLVTRSSNNFGPYQYPEKLVPVLILKAMQGEPLPIYGDGSNVRDWIYVIDNCSGIATVLERGTPGEAYNIGGGNERTNLEIAHAVLETLGIGHDRIRFVRDRPGHDFRYSVDSSRLHGLGWRPQMAFSESLAATIAWYTNHQAWWHPLVSREW